MIKIENENYYKISEIVEITKIKKSTIHYYKELGLIPEPLVMNKNMIYYKEITISCLNLIKYLNENENILINDIKNLFEEYNIDFNNKAELILKTIEIINNGTKKEKIEYNNLLDELIKKKILEKKDYYTTKEIEIIDIMYELKKYDINDKLINSYIEQGLILAKIEKRIADEVLEKNGFIPEILVLDILRKLKQFVLNKQILKTFKGK